MHTIKFKRVFQIPSIVSLCFILCACEMDGGEYVEPSTQMEYTQGGGNEYSKVLDAYEAFMRGDIGLNDDPAFTIAPTPDTKYAILDMNDDGIPELAVTTVIFQERNPDTLELESTSFGSAIFSYENGEVFIWGGGDHRHNNFDILSNKALLYDCDDGHGGREIIYDELDESGDSICTKILWNSPDGRYYFIDSVQSDSYVEISEEEWQGMVAPILAMRTDLISWTPFTNMFFPDNKEEDNKEEEPEWLGESRSDGWRCEGACINPDGISCDSFLVRIISPDGSPFQEIVLSVESRTMPTGAAHWEDVNFDGEPDVLVHLGGGRGGTQGYAAVFWKKEKPK